MAFGHWHNINHIDFIYEKITSQSIHSQRQKAVMYLTKLPFYRGRSKYGGTTVGNAHSTWPASLFLPPLSPESGPGARAEPAQPVSGGTALWLGEDGSGAPGTGRGVSTSRFCPILVSRCLCDVLPSPPTCAPTQVPGTQFIFSESQHSLLHFRQLSLPLEC